MNKKISVIFFAFLFSLMLIGLVSANLTFPEKHLVSSMHQNDEQSGYFYITSSENATVDFSANITSGNDNGISITIPSPVNLTANVPQRVNFTITTQDSTYPGQKTVKVYATSNSTYSFSFDFTVKADYCSNGETTTDPKLKLTVDNPDNGHDYYAGDNISIDVNVDNRDNDQIDFVVEAQLYDLITGEEIYSDELDDSLDENSDNDYSLYIKVPSNIDKNHDYVINVKVYEYRNEDEQCKEDSKNINIKKRSYDLKIDKVVLNSAEACNSPFDLTVKVANTGSHDESNVQVSITNQQLGIDLQKTQDIDQGYTKTFSFTSTLPVVSPGIYYLQIAADSDEASDSQEIELDLQANCHAQVKDAQVFVMPQNAGNINQDTIFKATITNSGDAATTYNIGAQNYQTWATLTSLTPAQITLAPGQSQDVTIILKPLSNAASLNTFQVKVTFGNETRTQDASLSIQTNNLVTGSSVGFFQNLGKNIWFLIINIVLVLIVIGLIILLAIKPKKKSDEEPREARLRKVKRK